MARNLVAAIGLFAAAGGLAPSAAAQEVTTQPAASAPAAPTTQPAPPSPLKLDELTLELGLESWFDRRGVRFDTNDRFPRRYQQTNYAQSFAETFGVRSAGSLIDERVMQFDLAARFGLTQERYTEFRRGPDLHEDPHGQLLQYDLHMTLFPRGKVSASAFAAREDSRIPRLFLPSLDRTLEKYGADITVNDRTFPMRFSFEHVWDELTSRTRELRDDERRGHDAFRYEGTWQISSQHALRLEYEHNERTEQYSGSRTDYDTTRDYLTLNHLLRFGPQARSALETLARFQNERGDLARDRAEVSTRLRLQHTDSFSTNYAAQFLQDAFAELATRTWRGEAGLTHQLGQTLTSTLQFYGLRQSADENADFNEWGSLANFAFSRDNPWGRLSANLAYNHASTDTQDGTRRGVVIGESITFRDPLPAYLTHADIDRGTLVVLDAGRTRTYLIGRDYVLFPVGRYSALKRVPTGQIADWQTVLVMYTYKTASDYDIRRDRVDFRLQQDFKFGLTPYYAASVQDEDLDRARFVSFRARNVNRHRVGATFRQPRWSIGGEYEYNDDAIDPYQALHFNGDVVVWQKAQHQLDAKGELSRFWFDFADGLPAHDTTHLDLGTSYRYLLARYLELNASAAYRYEDDSIYGITHGVDLTAALEWKLGYFSLRLETEYDVLSLRDSRDDSFSVWLKLKRDIPVIARSE